MPTNRRGKGRAVAQGYTDCDAQTAHYGTRGSVRAATRQSTRGSVAPPTSPREGRRYRRAGALADSGGAAAAATTTSSPTATAAATVPSLRRIEGAGVFDSAAPPHSVDSLTAVLPGPSSLGKIAEDSGAGIVDAGTLIIPAAVLPGKKSLGKGDSAVGKKSLGEGDSAVGKNRFLKGTLLLEKIRWGKGTLLLRGKTALFGFIIAV